MANIPKAREILNDTLQFNMSLEVRAGINEALSHMVRVFENDKSACEITQDDKRACCKGNRVAPDVPSYVAARNRKRATVKHCGRVSEALSGKYDATHIDYEMPDYMYQ